MTSPGAARATMRAAMANPQLFTLDAVELTERLARGEVSSREVTQAHLDRIAARDGEVHAFTSVLREQALADADRADAERAKGEVRGPLHGLPMSIKECFDFAGQATTIGVAARTSHRATRDAAMVELLRESGAVLLGRTNLSQFMLFNESRNPVFGQSANPFSLEHATGGSSGGEAAAIAAGMSPLGIGTDIGGSIRVPAAQCGIAGLKPTLDYFPLRGCQSGIPGQEVVRAAAGPMARSVRDLELVMRALDPARMSRLDARVAPLAPWRGADADLRKLRVGVLLDDGFVRPSHAVARAVEQAGKWLAARGVEVVPFAPPGVHDAIFAYIGAFSADAAQTMEAMDRGGPIDPALVGLRRMARMPAPMRAAVARLAALSGEPVLARLVGALGRKPVEQLWKLTVAIRAYRFEMQDAWEAARLDAVVCPPYATPALPHGMSKDFALAGTPAMLWNIVQFPSGVVPVGRVRAPEARRDEARDKLERHAAKVDAASAGLPVAVQVVARPWAEPTVLALLAAIEADARGEAEYPLTPV